MREGKTMNVMIGWILLSIFVLIGSYLLSILMFSKSDLRTFYVALPAESFAFVTKGGDPVRIIYNSKKFKLVDAANHTMGKFVEITEGGDEKQKLGPIEEMLGVRFIGIPFVNSLLVKKDMKWFKVGTATFVEEKGNISTFAITHTFGFKLPELTLGRDIGKVKTGTKKSRNDQKMQRILVDLFFTLQAFIRDPYKAIVETNWMTGTEGKLSRNTQATLGTMSQDELIADQGQSQLVENIIKDLANIQVYGAEFEKDKIVYFDYKLAGNPDDVKRVLGANTERFVKEQEAAGIRAVKAAQQEGLKTQEQIMVKAIKNLIAGGMTSDQAERIVRQMLDTEALKETKVTTYVKSGSVTTAV